jgi:hypothetical protein
VDFHTVLAQDIEILRQILVHQGLADSMQGRMAAPLILGVFHGVLEQLHVHVELRPRRQRGVAHDAIDIAVAIDLDLGDVHVLDSLDQLRVVHFVHHSVVALHELFALEPSLDTWQALDSCFYTDRDHLLQGTQVVLLWRFLLRGIRAPNRRISKIQCHLIDSRPELPSNIGHESR